MEERAGGSRSLDVHRLGRLSYAEGLELQAHLVEERRADAIPDTLLLVEHPHVITLGTGAHEENVLADEGRRRELGIELYEVGRGGDVTYHGPGQLVGYPILDLKPDRKDVHRYLRDLEETLIRVATSYGIEADRTRGRTGVWTRTGKLAAIGVRLSSGWITSHGFALNVSTDLGYFRTIVPCGISDRGVTSLERELGRPVTLEDASERVVEVFSAVFECQLSVA